MDAVQTPVRRSRREAHTADMEVGQRPDIFIPDTGPLVREPESIEPVETPIGSDYAAELAFMEEPVKIRIEPLPEKFSPPAVDVYVNGQAVWIPVGREFVVKRKFVEALARSKPTDVSTAHEDATVDNPNNRVIRTTRSKYPFSVIRDDNPRGYAWLTKLMAEG